MYLASILISLGGKLFLSLRMFKDLFDSGYKVNVDNIRNENLPSNASFNTTFIPILNLIDVFDKIMKYEIAKSNMLDGLNVFGILEELTKREKELYEKNPTGLNAMKVFIQSKMELDKSRICEVKTPFGLGKIYYFGTLPDDITIVKIEGPLGNKTDDELKEIIKENHFKELEKLLENSFEELFNSLNSPDTVIVSFDSNGNKKELTKEELEAFKHDLELIKLIMDEEEQKKNLVEEPKEENVQKLEFKPKK